MVGVEKTLSRLQAEARRPREPPLGVDGRLLLISTEQGVELPYSCKAGVCATCRTFVQKGEVEMAANYGLEPWEVEKGFVLACQCTPISDEVLLNYDKTS